MNSVIRLISCASIFLCFMAQGQELVKQEYLVKVETMAFSTFSGATNVCLLVWKDGRYRMERTRQDRGGGKPEIRVLLDTLPEASLKQLQVILEDGQFKAIKKRREEGSAIVQNLETMQVVVPREHEIQEFFFVNAEDRRPYEKSLKPFMNWLKEVQKRKVTAANEEKPNRCAAPMVQYRYKGPPPEMPQDRQ